MSQNGRFRRRQDRSDIQQLQPQKLVGQGYVPANIESFWSTFQGHRTAIWIVALLALGLGIAGSVSGILAAVQNTNQLNDPPYSIVIGTPTEGVVSFPVTPPPMMARSVSRFKTRMNMNSRKFSTGKEPHFARSVMKKHRMSRNKRLPGVPPPVVPILPGLIPGGTFPYPGSIQADSFSSAMKMLQGTTVYNTTIFVHPGTYNENFVIDGFSASCSYSGSSAAESSSRETCQTLYVFGDTRSVAGQSYVKGAFFNGNPQSPLLGSDNGEVDVVCSGANTITVTTTPLPDFSVFGDNPDFSELGLVAGDVITLYNHDTETFSERNIVSVSANTVTFDGIGCPIGGKGSSVTFMPNRIIQSQGHVLTGDALIDTVQVPMAGLTAAQGAVVIGFWIKAPPSTEHIYSNVVLQHPTTYVTNIVVDSSQGVDTADISMWYWTPSSHSVIPGTENFNEVFFQRSPVYTLLGGSLLVEGRASAYPADLVIIGGGGGGQIEAPLTMLYGADNLQPANTVVVARSGETYGIFMQDKPSFYSQSLMVIGGDEANLFASEQSLFRDQFGLTKLCNSTVGVLATGKSMIHMGDFLDAYGAFEDLGVAISVNESASVLVPNRPAVQTNIGEFFQHADSAYLAEGYFDSNSETYKIVERRPSMIHGDAGPLQPDYRTQVLVGTEALPMTLPGPPFADIDLYLNKNYDIYSTTAFTHNITLSGGATWDGSNTVATYGGAIGDGFSFKVVSSTVIVVTSNTNVAFS